MKRIKILLLIACLFLGGCGANTVEEKRETEQSAAVNKEFVLQGENELSVKSIKSVPFEKVEDGYQVNHTFYDVMKNRVYMIRVETNMESKAQRLCVQTYDCEVEKPKEKPTANTFVPEIPGHEAYYILSVDLTNAAEISLKLMDEGEDKPYLVTMDLQGEILSVEETFPGSEVYPWNPDLYSGERVYDLADGSTIVGQWDEEKHATIVSQFDKEREKLTEIGRVDDSIINAMCRKEGEEDVLYCLTGGDIIRWDTKTDAKEKLFGAYQNGVDPLGGWFGLTWNSQGELLLCIMGEKSTVIYVLTDGEVVNAEEIRLACIERPIGVDYIRKLSGRFSAKEEGFPIAFESVEEKYQEDYRNRIFMELSSGKGPDIMWVDREDMILLQEKGFLEDISAMIPKDIREVLLPAWVELCTVNGEMVGFTPEVKFSTMVTSKEVWEKDGWNISEYMSVLESRNDWEVPAVVHGGKVYNASCLYALFFQDPHNSPYVDLEQGISYFNSEGFAHVLKICKQCGDEPAMLEREGFRMVKEGTTTGEIFDLYGGVDSYSSRRAAYGEECHFVGYPAEVGSGNYIDTYSVGYLVVNANSPYKEQIGNYLAYLLDYEKQYETSGCSVRMDVLRDSVIYQEGVGYFCAVTADKSVVQKIELKPDGSTYLEEFLEFVESCEAAPTNDSNIGKILGEETAIYFQGEKSAEDTAEVIHRRVQLYLDERK